MGFNAAFVHEMLHFHKNNYEPGGKTIQTKSVTEITSANHTKYSENDLCLQYHHYEGCQFIKKSTGRMQLSSLEIIR